MSGVLVMFHFGSCTELCLVAVLCPLLSAGTCTRYLLLCWCWYPHASISLLAPAFIPFCILRWEHDLVGQLCTNVQLLATRTFKGCIIGSPCQRDLPTCIEFKKQKMYNFAPWLNTREMVGHKCACVCTYGDYCSQA